MQREREGKEIPSHQNDSFGSFAGGFRSRGGTISSIFGGRDPFDDPFFSRPFGSSIFASPMFGFNNASPPQTDARRGSGSNLKGPVIEELSTDEELDEGKVGEEEGDVQHDGENQDRARRNAWANRNPLVEHPDEEPKDHENSESKNKVAYRTDRQKVERKQPQAHSVSYQRVTYGGIDGAYYTATTTRRSGTDGMVLEESRQANKSTGQAAHRVSRGIHDKGHSVLRKLNSDGKVDTTQTLHNLHEDELSNFDEAWNGNANVRLPGWIGGFDSHANTAPHGWALSFREPWASASGNGAVHEAQTHPSQGRQKKVVRINID